MFSGILVYCIMFLTIEVFNLILISSVIETLTNPIPEKIIRVNLMLRDGVLSYKSLYTTAFWMQFVYIGFGMLMAYILSRVSFKFAEQIQSDFINHNVFSLRKIDQEHAPKYINLLNREMDRLSCEVILPLMIFISRLILVFGLCVLFVLKTGFFIMSVLSVVMGGFLIMFIFTRHLMRRNGELRKIYSEKRLEVSSDIISGLEDTRNSNIKGVLIRKLESAFTKYGMAYSFVEALSTSPKYIIEGTFFLIMVVYALLTIYVPNTITIEGFNLPLVVLVVVRMLPTINQLYQNAAKFKSNIIAFDKLKVSGTRDNQQKLGFAKISRLKITEIITPSFIKGTQFPKSVEFIRGNIYVFMGPSGSGKTTFCKLISGRSHNKQPLYEVDGKQIEATASYNVQDNFFYLPQKPHILSMDFVSNVLLEESWSKLEFDQVKLLADELGLPKVILEANNLKDLNLSGGEIQRIGLMRAFFSSCQILILDEPSSAQDMNRKEVIYKLLCKLSKNKIIIVVSHDSEILRYADDKIMF